MVAAALFALALVLYLVTLAPTVTLVDSGELIVAARHLGVPHPPGFPMYVLLAHVASLVPWGSVAQRVNAASAVAAAVAVALMVLAAREGLARRGLATEGEPPAWRWPDLLPPAMAGLLLAASRTLWSYATLAEVYALNTTLLVGVLWGVLGWRRDPARGWRLVAAAGVFGLALGVHHVTVALALPAFALIVLGTAGRELLSSRRVAVCALAGLAALVCVYAYLPWAASREPVLNWGNPVSLERLLWHVSGRQYQAFLSVASESAGREAGAYLAILARQFGPAGLPLAGLLAVAGGATLWRRDRLLLGSLGLLAAANAAYGLAYAIAEDKDAYYLPSMVALVLLAAFGAQEAVERGGKWSAGLLLVPAVAAAGNWRACDKSRYWIAEDYVANVLDAVAPGGMLLTSDWQLYSPLLYSREVEGRRADVVAVDVQLLRRSWYYDDLRRNHPGFLPTAGKEVTAFLEDLRAWDQDPGLYDRDRALNRRINDRFFGMILALVAAHLETAPVYVTRDVALAPFSPDPELPALLAQRYALVPQGLVFELTPDRSFRPPLARPLRLRGLFDASLRFERDDVVNTKLRPAYLTMIASRGLYLSAHGRPGEAAQAFRAALELDPGFAPARSGLARAEAMTQPAAPRQ